MKYKCKKCGAEFVSFRPLLLWPVCERCKREKEQSKDIKDISNKKQSSDAEYEQNKSAFFGFILLILIGLCIWGYYRGCAAISYWDKIYVKNNLKTYSDKDFNEKDGKVEIVKFDEKDMLNVQVPVYNKNTGEEKNITLQLPIYGLWTKEISRETLEGKKVITSYEQPVINDGYNYIKPQDAILMDTKEYNQLIEQAKNKYSYKNIEFKNWSFKIIEKKQE